MADFPTIRRITRQSKNSDPVTQPGKTERGGNRTRSLAPKDQLAIKESREPPKPTQTTNSNETNATLNLGLMEEFMNLTPTMLSSVSEFERQSSSPNTTDRPQMRRRRRYSIWPVYDNSQDTNVTNQFNFNVTFNINKMSPPNEDQELTEEPLPDLLEESLFIDNDNDTTLTTKSNSKIPNTIEETKKSVTTRSQTTSSTTKTAASVKPRGKKNIQKNKPGTKKSSRTSKSTAGNLQTSSRASKV